MRPRLIRRLSAALSTGTALISGPHGAGKGTLVHTWARLSGASVVWLDTAQGDSVDRASLTAALEGAGAVVAVLRGRDAQDPNVLSELSRLQVRHPALQVVLLRGLGMSLTAEEPDVRPGAVVTARELAFTATEIMQLGELLGAQIGTEQAQLILAQTGGYALAVDAVVRAVHRTGRLTESLLEETADLLMGVAADGAGMGAISADAWHRMLRTAIPDSLSFAQLGWIWGTDEPERMVRLLEGSGLVQVVTGADGSPELVLVTALRSGLRRRLQIELSRSQLADAVTEVAQWLDAHGDTSGAAGLLLQHGLLDELGNLIRSRWDQLSQLPSEQVRRLLRVVTAGSRSDPRLLVAHARALVDVLHAGHDGNVRAHDARRAASLLDRASAEGIEDDPELVTTALGLRAVLARVAGDHDRAHELLALAQERLGAARSRWLRSWLHAQRALTALGGGDLSDAAADLRRALDSFPETGPEEGRQLLVELDRLVHGYLGTRHPTDEGALQGCELHGLARSIRALSETSRLIAQLDVTGAWEMLEQLPIATGAEDPAALPVLRAQAEAMAHLLAGIPVAGLGALDVIDALLQERTLSVYESALMRNTRAELLVAIGEPESALAVLGEVGEHVGMVATLIRCVVLLALERADDAVALVEPMLPSTSTWAAVYPTWMLVVSALAYHDLGEAERADQLLGRGLAIAARSGAMLPFARQGHGRMLQLIERARELRMDPGSRALVDQLEVARDRLRLSSVQARLSDRELVVLERLSETGATRKLAALLHVSPNTVKSQLQSIYRKLGASTRDEALRAATMLGLLEGEPG